MTTAPSQAMSQDTGAYTLDIYTINMDEGVALQQEQDELLRVIGYASKTFSSFEE